MRIHNPSYFNTCHSTYKLTLLLICCLLSACDRENRTKQVLSTEDAIQNTESAININTASASELEKLPHIGAKTAQDIVEHRERFGKFRKPEHLMLVRRISDKRFREIRDLIKAE